MAARIGGSVEKWWLEWPPVAAFTVVFLVFPLAELLSVPAGAGLRVLGGVGIVAFGGAIATVVARAAPEPGRGRGLVPLGWAVLVATLPVPALGMTWLMVVACYLVVLVPLVLPAGRVLIGELVALVLVGCGFAAIGADVRTALAVLGLAALIGLATTVVCGLGALSRRQAQSRVELADARALAERRRLAGSLGDLLDERLTMIADHADRVQTLGPTDPEQAGALAAEIGSQARALLAELQAELAELQTVSLAAEARSAATLLEAAGVRARIRIPSDPLAAGLDEQVGWILREATTNVVRHAGATRCEIDVVATTAGVSVSVADDGPLVRRAAGVAPEPLAAGEGLSSLQTRAESVGGELTFGDEEGWFRLRGALPATATATAT